MEINKVILEILKEKKIGHDDGICCLLALYHGYLPTYIPYNITKSIHDAGIVNIITKKEKTGPLTKITFDKVEWNVPLYQGVETAFGWVATEYIPLFKAKNRDKGGYKREATARMKKFFSENPEARKDEVIAAVKLYLRQTDGDYIRLPHYFISKGIGLDRVSELESWLERYREAIVDESAEGRTSVTNTIQ